MPAYPTVWQTGCRRARLGASGTEPSPGTKLSVTDTVASVTSPDSSAVVVTPADPGTVTFTQQPTETKLNDNISPAGRPVSSTCTATPEMARASR